MAGLGLPKMPCCRVATSASAATQQAIRAKAKAKREAEEQKKKAVEEEEEEVEHTGWRKYFYKTLDLLDQTWLQTIFYIVFLLAFQSLTGTMRHPEGLRRRTSSFL